MQQEDLFSSLVQPLSFLTCLVSAGGTSAANAGCELKGKGRFGACSKPPFEQFT